MREWLIVIRKSKRMTQGKVAESVGINRTHYNAIERGNRRPSPEVAKLLGKLLSFEWTIFFDANVAKSNNCIN